MLCVLKQRGTILIHLTPHNLANGEYVYKAIHHTQAFHFILKYMIVNYSTNIFDGKPNVFLSEQAFSLNVDWSVDYYFLSCLLFI